MYGSDSWPFIGYSAYDVSNKAVPSHPLRLRAATDSSTSTGTKHSRFAFYLLSSASHIYNSLLVVNHPLDSQFPTPYPITHLIFASHFDPSQRETDPYSGFFCIGKGLCWPTKTPKVLFLIFFCDWMRCISSELYWCLQFGAVNSVTFFLKKKSFNICAFEWVEVF